MISAIIMMLVLGAILGLILGVADKVFYVAVDERVEKVTSLLPGYNCGGCGFAGCSGMASALVNKEVDSTKLCKPSNPAQRESIINYLKETPGPDGTTIQLKG